MLMARKTPRDTVGGRENPHGETGVRDARSPHQRKAPEQSRPSATDPEWRKKTSVRGLDNSGNIEGISKGI